VLKKKFGPIFKELQNFLPKDVKKLFKIWVRDPGSGIRKKNLFMIPEPGSRGKKGTGSRIRNTDCNSRSQQMELWIS